MRTVAFIVVAIVLSSIGLAMAISAARTIEENNAARNTVLVEALR